MGGTLDALSLQWSIFNRFWLKFWRFWDDVCSFWEAFWDKKTTLGQIVPKTSSGANRSTDSLWDKSFQKQPLGQIVSKTTTLELYATRHMAYAIRQTLQTTSGTNRSKNKLWDKSFQKTYSGTNRSTKQKTIQQILPTKPSQKKRGRAFSPLGGSMRPALAVDRRPKHPSASPSGLPHQMLTAKV